MDIVTSKLWHRILLSNFYVGVLYLNNTPLKPEELQKYEFPLKQSDTYRYHLRAILQGQIDIFS